MSSNRTLIVESTAGINALRAFAEFKIGKLDFSSSELALIVILVFSENTNRALIIGGTAGINALYDNADST